MWKLVQQPLQEAFGYFLVIVSTKLLKSYHILKSSLLVFAARRWNRDTPAGQFVIGSSSGRRLMLKPNAHR